MPSRGEVGVLVPQHGLVSGQVPDAFAGQGEQQGERAGGPDVDGHGRIGQALLQELPAFVVAEQVSGLLARDERDGELAGETAFGGPFQEIADEVAGLRAAGFQPPVDVVLAQVAQCQFLLIKPGQQVQGEVSV